MLFGIFCSAMNDNGFLPIQMKIFYLYPLKPLSILENRKIRFHVISARWSLILALSSSPKFPKGEAMKSLHMPKTDKADFSP